ncbi:extracellular solute-binding protein [Glycomyces sp. TRM65418]|uniref:extracellular solute-binding protein n=1 Tax=Glycomyces sp. TRM65418 TaxID=2867006 RepID=UPI001CE525D6|nr:extracellular solute-binding protein [Glycomyces sp. TRM65418]MCC3764258.1 extracellular solute-binding protein [Glycomyces sp. TRM65418]QZD53942.1 extracellular solute-binding protein [Glycomyces sp. TRM65418]
MATPSDGSIFRRRSLFKAAGLGAAGAAGLPFIAACSDIESGSGTAQVQTGFDFLPEYKEWKLPLEPDLVGEPPNHPSGFTSYPETVQAVTDLPSGTGTYELTVPMWGEAPSRDDEYYATVNEAWGGTVVHLRHSDGNTYAETSQQWLQANEFGDAIQIFSWMLYAHPNFRETVVNSFYDLTDLLSGDISDRWPLLASLGDEVWARAVWSTDPEDPESARIFGIPGSMLGGTQNAMFYRTDLLEQLGMEVPTTTAEVLEVARAFSDDAAGKWAFLGSDWLTPAWFGLASGDGWAYIDGKLVHNSERPEYTEWLEFRRILHDEKLQHPDIASGTLDTKQLFKAGTSLFQQDGMTFWSEYTDWVNSGEAPGGIGTLGAIAVEGRTPLVHAKADVEGWVFLNKDLSQEQVEELLDVANFCSAPYGTKEWELLEYGVEGTHFNYGEDGTPVYTDLGVSVVQAPVNYKTFSGEVQKFLTGPPAMVQALFDQNAALKEYFEEDIWAGVRVEAPAAFTAAAQNLQDQENDVAYGRAELSEIPAMVETFLNNGGEEGREHFTAVYESLHGE